MDYSKPLPNQRHEKFVLGLLEGKTDVQAAGYKPDRGNAGRGPSPPLPGKKASGSSK